MAGNFSVIVNPYLWKRLKNEDDILCSYSVWSKHGFKCTNINNDDNNSYCYYNYNCNKKAMHVLNNDIV